MERAPTGSEFEAHLQPRREEEKRQASMSHMSSGSRGRARLDLDSPSSRVSNVGENRNLHKRMLGLEESIKLIMAALKIGNVGSTQTMSDNIARVEDISTAPENTGGVDNMESAQEKIGGFENSETLVPTIGAVQGDSNVRKLS